MKKIVFPSAVLIILFAAILGCGSGEADNGPRVRIVSPSPGGVANDARPTVRWEAVPEAVRYVVSLTARHDDSPLDHREVNDPELQVSRDLEDRQSVRVRVQALDAEGRDLGRGEASFYVLLLPGDFPRFDTVLSDPSRVQPSCGTAHWTA